MKKVLSFVLVLSMILGSFGMAFAAAPSDVVGKDYEDAVNVLMELGVVEGYKDGTYRPEKVVTRAEMATLIIKALGLNDYAVGKSGFSDMAGHWADAYVAYAASLGFISGATLHIAENQRPPPARANRMTPLLWATISSSPP